MMIQESFSASLTTDLPPHPFSCCDRFRFTKRLHYFPVVFCCCCFPFCCCYCCCCLLFLFCLTFLLLHFVSAFVVDVFMLIAFAFSFIFLFMHVVSVALLLLWWWLLLFCCYLTCCPCVCVWRPVVLVFGDLLSLSLCLGN